MEKRRNYKELLRRNRFTLVRDLEPQQLLNYLLQEGALQETDLDNIKTQPTRIAKAEKFLDILSRRGPKAFDIFCIALQRSDGQKHLLESLLGSGSASSGNPYSTVFKKNNLTAESQDSGLSVQDKADIHPQTEPLEVKTISHQESSDDKTSYPMNSRPHGWCLIVNNVDFINLRRRGGSDTDAEKLKALFRYLQYGVKLCQNLQAKQLREVLFAFARQSDHQQADSVVVCLLSHGLEGQIYGVDGVLVSVSDLLAMFNGYHAKNLIGKPKLFFIQACRGSDFDHGIEMTDSGVDFQVSKTTAELLNEAFPSDVPEKIVEPTSLPAEADMLIAYSTVPGYVSWSNLEKGSWFVQALFDVFGTYASSEDVVSMLVRVNSKVALEFESNSKKKQIPAPVIMLTRKVFFHPASKTI